MATLLLRRAATPLLRLRLHRNHHHHHQRPAIGLLAAGPNCRNFSSESELTRPNPNEGSFPSANKCSSSSSARAPLPKNPKQDDDDDEEWKVKEAEILADIQPLLSLIKDILHSLRYANGDQLTQEDEKIIVEKVLAHHPHSEDKIGCGLDSIMLQGVGKSCNFLTSSDPANLKGLKDIVVSLISNYITFQDGIQAIENQPRNLLRRNLRGASSGLKETAYSLQIEV